MSECYNIITILLGAFLVTSDRDRDRWKQGLPFNKRRTP